MSTRPTIPDRNPGKTALKTAAAVATAAAFVYYVGTENNSNQDKEVSLQGVELLSITPFHIPNEIGPSINGIEVSVKGADCRIMFPSGMDTSQYHIGGKVDIKYGTRFLQSLVGCEGTSMFPSDTTKSP